MLAAHFALGVNVEQHNIRWNVRGKTHIGQNGIVNDFLVVDEVVDGSLAVDVLVGEKIRKNFQKMRFTASKKTGDPNAHLVGCSKDTAFVAGEKFRKVLLQLPRDDILFQFLPDVGAVILPNLDNAFYVAVNRFCEQVFDHHSFSPQSTSLKAR